MSFAKHFTAGLPVEDGRIRSGEYVWGESYTFLPPASLAAGTGNYFATNIPVGMAMDPATGAFTGKMLQLCSQRTMIISRLGAADVSIDYAVGAKFEGSPLVEVAPETIHPLEAPWVTFDTVTPQADADADMAKLYERIDAALSDAGSNGASKFHTIYYQGRNFVGSSDPYVRSTDFSVTPNGNTFVRVVAQHAIEEGGRVRTGGLDCKGGVIWENFQHATYMVGSYSWPGNGCYYRCRYGGFWDGVMDYSANEAALRVAYGVKASFLACEAAAEARWIWSQGGHIVAIDCLAHHMWEDPYFLVQGTSIYSVGCINMRWNMNPSHGDGLQSGDPYDPPDRPYLAFQIRQYVNLCCTGGYGGTGMRTQREFHPTTGETGDFRKLDCHDVVTMASGVDSWVNTKGGISAFQKVKINGWVALPAYSIGGTPGMNFNTAPAPSYLKIMNVINSGIATGGAAQPPVGVWETAVNDQLASGANSIPAIFPNLAGGLKYKVRAASSTNARNRWTPDFPACELSIGSVRAWLSQALMRGGSWSSRLNPISDPLTWGVFPTSIPNGTAPTVTINSVNQAAGTASVTVDGPCYVFSSVGVQDDPDVDPHQAMNFMVTDGSWNCAQTDANGLYVRSCRTYEWLPAAGTHTITLANYDLVPTGQDVTLYAVGEGLTGKFSGVQRHTYQKAA